MLNFFFYFKEDIVLIRKQRLSEEKQILEATITTKNQRKIL